MPVKIKFRKRNYDINGEIQLGKALKRLGVNPLSVLAIRNGTLVTEDETLQDQDEVELIEVISGG
jgi:sulfur carrier protein ThiS